MVPLHLTVLLVRPGLGRKRLQMRTALPLLSHNSGLRSSRTLQRILMQRLISTSSNGSHLCKLSLSETGNG
ncbi:hypothetical protein GOP47_0024896 [Adiantum capillus-veneris]|uniref:Uncharacterized protein n=1 Tax=Adiantum capillus-veneris TaxID=13818 RepID=A0A9D4Z5G7_ADICA|nr:hypothetical protein GOP47_0024896 [Adiantum capillus-veneris]